MSYRNFKHVLGETSLERKCRFLFGICLLLVIMASFWWYGRRTDTLVLEQNPSKGELLVGSSMTVRHWEAWMKQRPEVSDYTPLVAWLSGNVAGDEYEWAFINSQATGGSREANDPFVRGLLRFYSEQQPEEPYKHRFTPDGQRYEYYRPIYVQKSCIGCHELVRDESWAEGDLMGLAKVTMSNEATRREQNMNRAILLATAIATVFVAMIIAYFIVRYVIVKPLKHLRDVSDSISHGDLEQRADIHTGDEFEELGVAFNRMLRHLVTAQEELRRLNSNLDLKVDELAQANMRLFELNRLKSDFLSTMSHELRTPLNSIIGFSDVLGSIKSLDDKQRRYVQNIQKSGKMLLDMINDILDLAKIESGKMEIRPTEFRIDQVVHAQCDMARPLTEKKNIDLETEIEPGLPPLRQDQGKVQQILNNLLSNAIKFTPEGGRIVISARQTAGDELELVVADTGVGIAEEDQKHVFEKFRQGRTVTPGGDAMTREYSGTGLGLSIVKELAKLLGGELTLQSELGKGSEFTVRLPWMLAEPSAVDSTLAAKADELARLKRDDFELPLGRTVGASPAADEAARL